MAIMRTCCCCAVRGGSVATGIYSMIISIIGIAVFAYDASIIPAQKELVEKLTDTVNQLDSETILLDYDWDTTFNVFMSIYVIGIIFLSAVVISSIMLFIGISTDVKELLLPFMVSKGLHLLWYVYYMAVIIYFLSSLATAAAAGYAYIFTAIVLGPFFAADLVCLLCVISQYQEYRDGRGRQTDVMAAQAQSTVCHQQILVPGPTAYAPQQFQGAPPGYYAPQPVGVKGVPGAI